MSKTTSLAIDEEESLERAGTQNGSNIHYGSLTNHRIGKNANTPKKEAFPTMVVGHQPLHQLERNHSPKPTRCNSSKLDEKALLLDEMASMAKLAIPVTFTYIFEMLPGIVTIVLVGRAEFSNDEQETVSLQKLKIDAAAIAVMFMNVVALSPGFGMLTAMDTLCSQAHGAKDSTKMGTYSLTGFAIISVVCLVSSAILWNAERILIMLGQPRTVSQYAGVFVRYILPGLPFNFAYELLRKVSQSRNEAMPMLISSIVCNIVTISLGYYLVHCTGWGWLGAAIGRSAGTVVQVPVILMAMIMGWGEEKWDHNVKSVDERAELVPKHLNIDTGSTLDGDSENDREFLQHLLDGFVASEALSPAAIIEFLTLGFPGMLQLMFEWCAFEVMALLCGLLPGEKAVISIGANAVIMNISSMTYMLYLGVSVSANVRIGNALGAGDTRRAEAASLLTLIIGSLMALVNITFLLIFRKSLPWLVTTDIDIVTEAQRLLIVAAVFQLPDAIGACVQAIFRGSGRQALAAKINFVAYYVIGIPIGYVLGISFGMGVVGLWCGMTIGLLITSLSGSILVLRSNWRELTDEASARLSRSGSATVL